jgi:hypothetical protein
MSTWINSARGGAQAAAAALVLSGLLSACMMPAGLGLRTGAPRTVAVAGGALNLGASQGFCVDQSTLRDDGASAFVLFGNCAALSGNASDPVPAHPVVLTAAVSAGAEVGALSESYPQMTEFFRSDAGRAALSRDGNADTVEVLDISQEDELLLLHLSDSAPMGGAAVAEAYWRAITAVNGRILSIAVLPLKDRPTDPETQAQILRQFAAQIRALN